MQAVSIGGQDLKLRPPCQPARAKRVGLARELHPIPVCWNQGQTARSVGHSVSALIRNAATAVGVITGAGTIVGWIVSTDSPAVVAGTAVGYAGMAYCAGFAILSFIGAILPKKILLDLEARGELARATLKARASYFSFGGLFTAFFVLIGTDPLDGAWITIGALGLAIVLVSLVTVHRQAVARREAEYQQCPDCAESIKREARVCRFCGYRLAPPPAAAPPSLRDSDAAPLHAGDVLATPAARAPWVGEVRHR
jgi:hypothetical protein